jgi:transposase-like protein
LDLEAIVEGIKSGRSLQSIGRGYGISRQGVSQFLKRSGIDLASIRPRKHQGYEYTQKPPRNPPGSKYKNKIANPYPPPHGGFCQCKAGFWVLPLSTSGKERVKCSQCKRSFTLGGVRPGGRYDVGARKE